MKRNKGFTLIELLVVIAIIGILSSVVLASLNTARNKGSDAAVKANLANSRAQAELYYDEEGNTYVGLCTASTGILAALDAAGDASSGTVTCDDGADGWTATAQLTDTADGEDQWFCVDSAGTAATTSSAVDATGDWTLATDDCASL